MADTSAQVEKMAEAARHVDNAGQALAIIRGTIRQSVDNTRQGYRSPAADLFRDTMGGWDSEFQKLIDGLDRIHFALTQTHRHYQATLEEEINSANEIATLLNGGGI
jgi:WXG100 family type VII secretion target